MEDPKIMLTTTAAPCPSETLEPAVEACETAQEDTETRLVARMVQGEANAWREFQGRYDRLIYRCITKVTARFSARISADDVKEIYATLLLQLLANDKHKLRSYDPARGNRFGSWIGLLAINAAYDHLRSVRRDSQRASLTEAESMTADTPDPYEVCEHRERAKKVALFMDDFSDKDRQFMELYFGEGLKPEEVAARMRISVKTVYSKKHKIQSRLEALIGKERMAA
jgi:RNA polymerase sigma-70 factor, ECF subfamily